MASTNLPSKLSRAVCAYLVSAGAVLNSRCYPAFTRRLRTVENGPIVTVDVWPGTPDPVPTGDFRFSVHVAVKGTVVTEAEDTDETERVEFDAAVGRVKDALMVSADGGQTLLATAELVNAAAYASAAVAAGNADLDDFTLLAWQNSTFGQGKAEDCLWEVVMQFECVACESKVG